MACLRQVHRRAQVKRQARGGSVDRDKGRTVVDKHTRIFALGVGAVLGFAVVWATVVDAPAIAISVGVLLVAFASVLVIAPDKLKLSGGGIDAHMERRQRERIQDVVEAGLDASSNQHAEAELPEATVPPVERSVGSTITREALKRFSEDLITESAEWGWMMGQMGFTTVPRPIVEWHGDQPRIMYGEGDPDGPRGGQLSGTERPGYDAPSRQ